MPLEGHPDSIVLMAQNRELGVSGATTRLPAETQVKSPAKVRRGRKSLANLEFS